MKITTAQVDALIHELKQPQCVLKDGGFYVVYAHGRWHLMTAGYTNGPNARQFIQSLHFMDDAGARRYFGGFGELVPVSTVDQMFPGFAQEVALKVLPTAQEYLPLVERGMLRASTGYTTDTTSISDIGARGKQFMKGFQKAMDTEVIGLAFQFTGPAPEHA